MKIDIKKGKIDIKKGKIDIKKGKIDIKKGKINIKKGMKGKERMTGKSKRDKGIEEEDVRGQ